MPRTCFHPCGNASTHALRRPQRSRPAPKRGHPAPRAAPPPSQPHAASLAILPPTTRHSPRGRCCSPTCALPSLAGSTSCASTACFSGCVITAKGSADSTPSARRSSCERWRVTRAAVRHRRAARRGYRRVTRWCGYATGRAHSCRPSCPTASGSSLCSLHPSFVSPATFSGNGLVTA